MFEDFTIKIENFTKDKASIEEVKTLKKIHLWGGRGRRKICSQLQQAIPEWNEDSRKDCFPKNGWGCGTQSRLVSKPIPLSLTDSLAERMSGLIPYRNVIVGCHRFICSFTLFDTLIYRGGEGNSRYSWTINKRESESFKLWNPSSRSVYWNFS